MISQRADGRDGVFFLRTILFPLGECFHITTIAPRLKGDAGEAMAGDTTFLVLVFIG